jgi:hypothetical protein
LFVLSNLPVSIRTHRTTPSVPPPASGLGDIARHLEGCQHLAQEERVKSALVDATSNIRQSLNNGNNGAGRASATAPGSSTAAFQPPYNNNNGNNNPARDASGSVRQYTAPPRAPLAAEPPVPQHLAGRVLRTTRARRLTRPPHSSSFPPPPAPPRVYIGIHPRWSANFHLGSSACSQIPACSQ